MRCVAHVVAAPKRTPPQMLPLKVSNTEMFVAKTVSSFQ